MSSRFGYTSKQKREIKQSIYSSIESEGYKKSHAKPPKDAYNPEIFDKGMLWFKEGMDLEDAPENIRNNTNFINGYKRAERLAKIEEMNREDEKARGSR